MNTKKAILYAVLCTFLVSLAQIFYKKGADGLSLHLPTLLTNWNLWTGLALYGAGAVVMMVAMKSAPLSTVYPVLALSYVWVSLMAAWFLPVPEKMNLLKWTGILFILAGVCFIGLDGENREKPQR